MTKGETYFADLVFGLTRPTNATLAFQDILYIKADSGTHASRMLYQVYGEI